MTEFTLYALEGWGSTIVEAALATGGLDYKIETVDPRGEGQDRLLALNPLGQLPTLVLPDGRVMTESAAIVLHISELRPEAGLAPPADDPIRPEFLRWLIFLVAAVYPTFAVGDVPHKWIAGKKAQAELSRGAIERRCRNWRMVEAAAKGPWFLGERFSAIDLYIGAMTHWRPGRAWFEANCPKLHAIALKADAHPGPAKVWKRNFD
ncbi:MAG: glutathione S-transferase family protein [Alphaproteobacteria bacterium]|nr:glutathione S-transferase family protein [Alphaproteobacteria bacterium]